MSPKIIDDLELPIKKRKIDPSGDLITASDKRFNELCKSMLEREKRLIEFNRRLDRVAGVAWFACVCIMGVMMRMVWLALL